MEIKNTNVQNITITMNSVVSDGLVVYLDAGLPLSYPGSGSTWTDLAGGDSNATLFNSPTYSSSQGGYLSFNGTNQYGTLAGTPLNLSAYTKCVWFYLNTTFDNNLISYSDPGGHYMFFGGTNTLYTGHTAWAGFPYTNPSVTTFSNSTWYFATVTFNTTDGMSLYVNNSLDHTYTAIKTAPTAGSVNIASYSAGGNLLNGRISQVLLYNRALTSQEVIQIYNSTKSRYGL